MKVTDELVMTMNYSYYHTIAQKVDFSCIKCLRSFVLDVYWVKAQSSIGLVQHQGGSAKWVRPFSRFIVSSDV
jgi:hypothetical protein